MGSPSIPSETRTTTTSEPYEEAKPYLLQGLQGTATLFGEPGTAQFTANAADRITGFSPETLAAMDITTGGALAGEGYNGAARDASLYGLGAGASAVGSTPNFGALAGSYIDPGTGMASYNLTPQDQAALGAFGNQNAVTNDLVQSVMDPVQARIDQRAAAAGRVGSPRHDYMMTKGLTDAVAPIVYDAQTGALNRGAQLYGDAATRSAGMTQTAFGLADQQFGRGADLLSTMAGLQPTLNDATRANAAALAQVGGEKEALDDAIRNAPYDQLTDFLQRIGYLSGFGGSTNSSVGVTDQGGGGFGLAQGLGGLITGATLASALGAF